MSLHLPLGFILELNNCYLAPSLCKIIISRSFKSVNNGCSIYYKNMFYGSAPVTDGLFMMNIECRETFLTQMLDVLRRHIAIISGTAVLVTLRRSAYISFMVMGFCSLDLESFDKCEACRMGKMAMTPFIGFVERAT